MDVLVTKVVKVEAKMKSDEKMVYFLNYKSSEQSSKLLEEDNSSSGYGESAVEIEDELASASSNMRRITIEHTV